MSTVRRRRGESPGRAPRSASPHNVAAELADAAADTAVPRPPAVSHQLIWRERAHIEPAGGGGSREAPPNYRGAHFLPTHVACQQSLLTSSELATLNVSGLVNLGALLLLVHNLRLVIENLYKHGWLFGGWLKEVLFTRDDFVVVFCTALGCLVPCVVMLASERLAAGGRLTEEQNDRIHRAATALVLCLPTVGVLAVDAFPHVSSAALGLSIMVAMKMHSYSLVNRDVRRVRDSGEGTVVEVIDGVDEPVRYPYNLTFGDLFYFLAAPTLCYQLNYPRTPHIRWPFVARRTGQMIFLITLAFFITEQYVAPTIRGAAEPLRAMSYGRLLERVLKLAVPNLYVWLIFFAVFFHYQLNIVAELLRFGDRRFYGDWWNASSFGYYWREWNIPVHTWLVRHVYSPARRRGVSRQTAGLYVFLLSAVAHELLVSVPCKMFAVYAFFGMLGQLPLITLTNRFKQNDVNGNILFWTVFCVFGQPLSVLLYSWQFLQNSA